MRNFKSIMARMLAVVLSVVTIMSIMITALPAAAVATEVAAYGNGNNKAYICYENKGGTVGQRIYVNGEFSAFSIEMLNANTKGSGADISVYKWTSNYSTTVAAEPLATKTLTDIVNKQVYSLEFSSPLPAGEYLFYVHNIKGTAGAMGCSENTVSLGCTYKDGLEAATDLNIKIKFTSAPETPFVNKIGQIYTYEEVNAYSASAAQSALDLLPGDTAGQLVQINGHFSGFSLRIGTYGKTVPVTFALYEWKGNWDDTVAQEPLEKQYFPEYKNDATEWLHFSRAYPAGQYLFAVVDVTDTIAVYRYRNNTVSKGLLYLNGAQYFEEFKMAVRIETGISNKFTKIDTYKDLATGDNQAPAESTIPDDSYIHEVKPSTWVFTDGLGRNSLTYNDVGGFKDDKTVSMFYWDWHYAYKDLPAINIQSVMEKYPEAKQNGNHDAWPDDLLNYRYYWNEPIYGYYSSTDTWVLRRQSELLASAGVDALFMDNSNDSRTWADGYNALFKVLDEAMDGGVRSPKVSFHLPMWDDPSHPLAAHTNSQVEQLYLNIYQPGKYQDLWFYLDGKPMLLAYGDLINTDTNFGKEMANFFTYRSGQGDYFDESQLRPNAKDRIGTWGWLSAYPQARYYKSEEDIEKGIVEQMTVGVAQNYNFVSQELAAMNGNNIAGRSFSTKNPRKFNTSKLNYEVSRWGYNFAEQFDYAIENDPKNIFITGWNEWVVRPAGFRGLDFGCADVFDDEFSRDLEPTKGQLKDHYYYQLVNYSRKYKGAEPIPTPSTKTVIDLSAGQSQWEKVEPYYAAYIGNTGDRDGIGNGGLTYTEHSGRNDIKGAQIARDDEYVYFNVECVDDITPYTDNLWMNLYIDTDQSEDAKGWESFEYVVNKTKATEKTSVLERFTGDGYKSEKVADVEYKVDGRYMTVKIAKSDLGISGDDYTINFSWTDNVHNESDTGVKNGEEYIYSEFDGDIMDFYISGDVAPGGRFKYSYISNSENAGTLNGGNSDNGNSNDSSDASAEAPEETTAEEQSGCGSCGSSVGVGAALIAAAGAAVVLRKKKED